MNEGGDVVFSVFIDGRQPLFRYNLYISDSLSEDLEVGSVKPFKLLSFVPVSTSISAPYT